MMKKTIISALVLSGGLLLAGQAIGQTRTEDQNLQRQGSEESRTEGSLGTTGTDADSPQGDTGDQSGFVSGSEQQRLQDERQFQDSNQRELDRQTPQQQEFGVSPRFDSREDLESGQPQDQGRSESGESSDMTRDQGSSSFQGTGQGQGRGGGSMQSGPGSGSGGSGRR